MNFEGTRVSTGLDSTFLISVDLPRSRDRTDSADGTSESLPSRRSRFEAFNRISTFPLEGTMILLSAGTNHACVPSLLTNQTAIGSNLPVWHGKMFSFDCTTFFKILRMFLLLGNCILGAKKLAICNSETVR